jgi:hypothetical protein
MHAIYRDPGLAAPRRQRRVPLSVSTAAVAAESETLTMSQPSPVDLVIYRGDTGAFRVTVTDTTGAAVDVSGATWDCDIRSAADDEAVMTSLTVTPVAQQLSQVDVALGAAASAALSAGSAVWDLEMTMDGQVTTLLAGVVTIIGDVSRTP